MSEYAVIDKQTFEVRALLLGERIDIRAVEGRRLARLPLTLAVPGGGVAVVLRYGAVVLAGVEPDAETTFLRNLQLCVSGPYDEPETESVEVCIAPQEREGMSGNAVQLADGSVERLQVVADVLSKSVLLARYEAKVAAEFDRVEPFAASLEGRGRLGRRARAFLQHIGRALQVEHRMVGRAEVIEKPELIWERPELERLYLRLEDEFEIRERYAALERKLELISRTAQTALELLHTRRSLRVEWYIVILILAEIVLTVGQMLFGTH